MTTRGPWNAGSLLRSHMGPRPRLSRARETYPAVPVNIIEQKAQSAMNCFRDVFIACFSCLSPPSTPPSTALAQPPPPPPTEPPIEWHGWPPPEAREWRRRPPPPPPYPVPPAWPPWPITIGCETRQEARWRHIAELNGFCGPAWPPWPITIGCETQQEARWRRISELDGLRGEEYRQMHLKHLRERGWDV